MTGRKVRHPIQPLVEDEQGVIRFKENAIVRRLLDEGGIDLNDIGCWDVSRDDFSQFAQLIGYSHDGYCGLSYSDKVVADAAEQMYLLGMTETEVRITALESRIRELETTLRTIACECEEAIPGIIDE